MLVFLDDSGDPGFKLDRGSSAFFVIACVIFEDKLDAEGVSLIMKRYRRGLGWADNYEFKFNKTKKVYIKELLRKVAVFDFKIRAIAVDKSKIYSNELRNRQDSFYNYTIKEVLSKSEVLRQADVRLDGHSGRQYKKQAITYLRREINARSHKIAKVRFVDSRTNNLIQLADLAAGSIHRHCQANKTDHDEYLEIIKERIDDIWYFR